MIEYARQHNVTKIIAGKPVRPRWLDLLRGSVVDQIIRHSGDIDVYVISGEADTARPLRARRVMAPASALAALRVEPGVGRCGITAGSAGPQPSSHPPTW